MINIVNMDISKAINIFHSITSIYFICGWIIPSQRINLVFLLPTLQYQFLVNNNMCLLTQLENKYLKEEEKNDSFTDKKLKEYGIVIDKINSERLVNSLIYLSFLMSYTFMDN